MKALNDQTVNQTREIEQIESEYLEDNDSKDMEKKQQIAEVQMLLNESHQSLRGLERSMEQREDDRAMIDFFQ